MVAEWMTALAATGAGALVGAAATDAWQGARDGIIRLFRQGGPRRQELAGAWLDADADAVEQADPEDRDQVRQQLLPAWQTRLADLLAEHSDTANEHSDVADELRELSDAVRAQLPVQQQAWAQTNIARDNGRVFAVQHGNLHYHESVTSSVPQQPDAGGSHQ